MNASVQKTALYEPEDNLVTAKLMAFFCSLLFGSCGLLRIYYILKLFIDPHFHLELYETNNIYVDYGEFGYTLFNGVVAAFFCGVGGAFLYLGVLKKQPQPVSTDIVFSRLMP